MGWRTAATLFLVAGAFLRLDGPAGAAECHPKPVRAKGSAGLLEAAAKSRARSAWIKRVRADKKLGRDYAAWLRASEPTYLCRKVGRMHVCEATAKPCRLEPAATAK